jgi:hypothetical protein
VDYAKSGRSTCQRSKAKIPQGSLRIGKVTPSAFNEDEMMTKWFLPEGFFEMMRKMRKDTPKVNTIEDLAGYTELTEEDQDDLRARIQSFWETTVTVTAPKKKAAPKKRASDGDDDEDVKVSPPKKKKPAHAPPKTKNEPHDSDIVPCSSGDLKSLAGTLLVSARQDGIKMPTDDVVGRQAAGTALVQTWDRENNTVDLGVCLDTLEKTHGTTRGAKVIYVVCEENRALAMAFQELAGFYFKAKNQMKGIALMKVFRTISNYDAPLTNGKQAVKLEGIGKSSANKVDEFVTTGTINDLETFRSGVV